MNAPKAALETKDTSAGDRLYMACELGERSWKLALSDGKRGPSRYTIAAGDKVGLLKCVAKAKARCGLGPEALVHSCYEAGRDGFWLHRWLLEQGVHNVVVDSASIEVNRRARRVKTDRLDGDKLLGMLMRYHGGESRLWSVLRVPSVEQEDARRVHRELERLKGERSAHSNRIGSLLVLQNLRPRGLGGRHWRDWWQQHSGALPARVRSEIEREHARLELVHGQIKSIEAEQRQALADGAEAQIAQLARLSAIGVGGAWVLVKELFGWRRFRNRRELAGCLGITPTPYRSGESELEQGISRAGNKRARWMLVELAWSWLRYQPQSALSLWFAQRFAAGGKRLRRIGIVALARRLAIALWRYLEFGQIPAGAKLKAIGA